MREDEETIVEHPSASAARTGGFTVAFLAVLCGVVWLTADVQIDYRGHLNGLFYTGLKAPMPPGAVGANAYRVQDDRGYDGEFYYLIAHDPLNVRGFLAYVDTPRYRWRRIGIPALAWLLAAGNDAWIDQAYVAIQLVFLFFGTLWTARYAATPGWRPAWGLLFLLIPGVAISLDRMTLDLPIAAITVALLLVSPVSRPRWLLYSALIAAPLIRETGLILIFAWCVCRVFEKDIRGALLAAACALPTLFWYVYVALHTTPDLTAFPASYPLGGLIAWTLHAFASPRAAYGSRASTVFEFVALAGVWLAFALAIRLALARRHDFPALLAMLFALFAAMIGYQDIWASAYGLGRTLTPLLIALAAIALRDRRLVFALPMLTFVPRIALQFASEIRVGLHAIGRL